MAREYRLLSTSGLLGYGFPEASLKRGIEREPHMIGVDGGSTDPGPFYLGSGECLNSAASMRRDLALMLRASTAARIPLVIGSCGGAGGDSHLGVVVDLVKEIAREDSLHFRLAVISAGQDKRFLQQKVRAGHVRPLRNVLPLTEATVERASNIVGMMGPEPFMQALDAGATVVLAGRSTDPAPWAGCAIRAGCAPAPSWYAGKMLECGSTPALPKGHDCLFVRVLDDHIISEPTNPDKRCTPFSVATHSLHENASPIVHEEPGGILDTSGCSFTAVSDRAVKISGMVWKPQPYTVKLEGAELVGYRAITICATRDPILIAQIDSYLGEVREEIARRAAAFGVPASEYKLVFHVYGRDGVMGDKEIVDEIRSHEVCLVVEVVSDTQDKANSVLSIARVVTPKVDFNGRLCKSGNMAFPFSPSDISVGPVYRFSVFHVVEHVEPLQMFRTHIEQV
jgi:hypothetical protein